MNFTAAKVFVGFSNRIIVENHVLRNRSYLLTCRSNNKRLYSSKVKEFNRRRLKKQQEGVENRYIGQQDTGLFGYSLLAVPILTFVLGTWQVRRRQWKLDLIKDLESRRSSEVTNIPENLAELEDKEYCPVRARGRFLYDKEFIVGPRSLIVDGAGASEKEGSGGLIGNNKSTGYYVITPFKLEDRDVTILVNRGWVPPRLKLAENRKSSQVDDVVEITGVVRLNEERPPFLPKNKPTQGVWMYRDVNAMAEISGSDPVYVDLVSKYDPPDGPISGQTRISIRNEHMSYIITWYSLSIITSWMWYRQFIQKLPLL